MIPSICYALESAGRHVECCEIMRFSRLYLFNLFSLLGLIMGLNNFVRASSSIYDGIVHSWARQVKTILLIPR